MEETQKEGSNSNLVLVTIVIFIDDEVEWQSKLRILTSQILYLLGRRIWGRGWTKKN